MWHPTQPDKQQQPVRSFEPFRMMAMQQQNSAPFKMSDAEREALHLSQIRRQRAMLAANLSRKVA